MNYANPNLKQISNANIVLCASGGWNALATLYFCEQYYAGSIYAADDLNRCSVIQIELQRTLATEIEDM